MKQPLDLRAVRAGLVDALTAATDLRRVDPYVPETVSPTELPLAFVGFPDPVTYQVRFGRGAATSRWTVTVLVGRNDLPESVDALDALLSQLPLDESGDDYLGVVDALLVDPSLAGACSTLAVESAENPRVVDVGDSQFLAYDLTVRTHS